MQGKIETRVGLVVLAALGVFIYMGFQIGAFRFDRGKYAEYSMYFKDITGLSRKAEVKIAGVKVGWVEKIRLLRDHDTRAQVYGMILKEYPLYKDAYAIVRQDGLLGPKYIEINPGDPLLPEILPGQALSKPSQEPVNIDQLLQEVQDIATNIKNVSTSLNDAVGHGDGRAQLTSMFNNLHQTSERLVSFTETLDRSLSRNEQNIDQFLSLGNDIRRLSQQLETSVLPSFQQSMERVANVFDRDFGRLATRLEATAESIEDASIQARDGLRNVSSVAQKIDEGKGVLGKLINEDETYHDLRDAIAGFKNYLGKIDRMQIVFDSHSESMLRPAENYRFEDSKGYFDIRIHPNQDHFYLIQLVSSEKGFAFRKQTRREFLNECDEPVDPCTLDINDNARLRHIFTKDKQKFKRNTFRFGFQFGKVFDYVALRIGLMEGSAGFGFDIDIPFNTNKFRWVTTFEAFDLAGWNRLEDRRPHLKWLNRMFILRNLYFTFGADDFISKRNANAFFGAGIRFGDDDVKYLISSVGTAGSVAFAEYE